MKFNIKDFNYLGIILALLITIFAMNIQHKQDSFSRITKCFADVVEEPKFCESFYEKHR
jgi:ABC-type sulfate transport system permease component